MGGFSKHLLLDRPNQTSRRHLGRTTVPVLRPRRASRAQRLRNRGLSLAALGPRQLSGPPGKGHRLRRPDRGT